MDFEKAIMHFDNLPDTKGSADSEETIPQFKITSMECLGANLQLVFNIMRESIRKSLDPSFLINAIGLDQNIQQV
jgi:translation initiation factor 2 beta subunit (eIF-2beta)/eIF-5